MEITTEIQLNLNGETKHYLVSAKQGDKATRYIAVQLLHNGAVYQIPEGISLIANFTKPDGHFCYNACKIQLNRVMVELTNQVLAAVGTAFCDIELRSQDNKRVLTSASFTIEIEPTMRNDTAIESSNEMTVLENRVMAMEATEAERVTQEAVRQTTETTRCETESSRVAAETARMSAETTRTAQEVVRQTDEATRVQSEQTRSTSETTRAAQEVVRQTNETARSQSEQQRAINETARITQEQARETNTAHAITNAQEATAAANNSVEVTKTFTTQSIATHNTAPESHAAAFAQKANYDLGSHTGDFLQIPAQPETSARIDEVRGKTVQLTSAQGKNLYDFEKFRGAPANAGGTIAYVGNTTVITTSTAKHICQESGLMSVGTTTPVEKRKYAIPITGGQTYTFSVTMSDVSHSGLYITYHDANYKSLAEKGGSKATSLAFAAPTGAVYAFVRVSSIPDTVVTQVTFSNIQLERGSAATAYEPFTPDSPSPDYPAPITGVGESGRLDVVAGNKNLLPNNLKSSVTVRGVTAVKNSDASITITGTPTEGYIEMGNFLTGLDYDDFKRSINPEFPYTICSGSQGVNISFVYAGHSTIIATADGTPKTFTPSKTAGWDTVNAAFLTINQREPYFAIKTTIYPQIERGSAATAYVPPQSRSTTIPLTSPLYSVNKANSIDSVADTIKASLKQATDTITHRIKKIELNGNWGWVLGTNGKCFSTLAGLPASTKTSNSSCSHFIGVDADTAYSGKIKNAIGISTTDGRVNCSAVDRFGTVEAFKAWLVANPVTVIYELATPTTEPIPSLPLLPIYASGTNIYTTDPVAPNLAMTVMEPKPVSFATAAYALAGSAKAEIDELRTAIEGTGSGRMKRYGFRIDKNDSNPYTRITYLYDAVGKAPARMNYTSGVFDYGGWKDVWFVRDDYPVMLRYDGTEDYKLNPNDYTKKLDGTASDVANTSYAGNAMSSIPTVWISQYEDSDYEYVILCEEQFNSTYHAYCHQREDGSIMQKRYFPMFEGYSDGTRLRSIAGVTPTASQTGEQEVTRAQANGVGWYTTTYNMVNLMWTMLTLVSKSDNSQVSFGNGNASGSAYLNTGTLKDKGQFFGYSASNQAVKVFHCENWWGNYWKRCAGLMALKGAVIVKPYPPYNATGEEFKSTEIIYNTSLNGYPNKTKMTSFGRFVLTVGGSASTYTCDYFWSNPTVDGFAIHGGARGQGDACGACFIGLTRLFSSTDVAVATSLSCEQPT